MRIPKITPTHNGAVTAIIAVAACRPGVFSRNGQ